MPRQHHTLDKSLQRNERILLVGVMLAQDYQGSNQHREQAFATSLAEAAELVHATGGELIEIVQVRRDKAHRALLIGSGKAEELAALVAKEAIDLVIFNIELSPMQERNLEAALQCRVLDRVGLILAIFAQRAQSQEGKLQVELAQLNHLAGRLVRGYGHLSGQRGGIGLKGPGETRLETDRRLIQTKIQALRRQLAAVKKQRATRRKARMASAVPTFAIVGYTNAGKSTLFNRLTKADVLAKDQLFATLDTTARRLYLNPDCNIVLTDTVGFVQDLPHSLVAAFSATLEETALADVLLHVIDATHSDVERQIDNVNTVLAQIGAENIPQLLVYNKIDRLPDVQQHFGVARNHEGKPISVSISAQTGKGIEDLRAALMDYARHLSA